MITVSGKCMCSACESRTQAVYRMVGACLNCGTAPVLMIFRVGDSATDLDCPVCGVPRMVRPRRLATADEIPAVANEPVRAAPKGKADNPNPAVAALDAEEQP